MGRAKAATVGAVAALSLALAGCSSAPLAPPIVVTHVHAVDLDEERGAVYVATHEGILRVATDSSESDAEPATVERLGVWKGDIMGMARLDAAIYFSGHPAPGENLPANIGLYRTDVGGQAFTPLALEGEVDFHSMTVGRASGSSWALAGIDSASGRVIVSRDGGVTWSVGAAISARAVSWDSNADLLYATTEEGLQVSTDDGATFTTVETAPPLVLITSTPAGASTDAFLAGVDLEGYVHTSIDGVAWVSSGLAPPLTSALSVGSGGPLVAAGIDGVQRSDDGGATWTVIAEF
jgi:hypothetical protein